MTRLAALFARLGPDPRADGTLLQTFLLDRDEAAFAELVRRHGPTVWGVCRRTLPDPADAEDAFQATFLVLLRRRPAGETLAPWLYRVAVLTSRGLRRRNARRRTVPLPEVPARPDPRAVDVDALLMRLPERERAAVVLCKLHGLTEREAADRLGVPEGTLSARLSRGLARLRQASTAGLTAAVPATVAEAAVTVAAAGRAAGPGVNVLVSEVLRMFWVKKLATAGLAVATAVGFVLLVRSADGPVAAQGTPSPATTRPQPQTPATMAVSPKPRGPNDRLRAMGPMTCWVVNAGEPHTFQLEANKPLAELIVQPRTLATATVDPNDPTTGVLTGLKPGAGQLFVRDTEGGQTSFVLAVFVARAQRFQLRVGEEVKQALPNGRRGKSVEPVSGAEVAECVLVESPTGAIQVRAKRVGSAQYHVTDTEGLVWDVVANVSPPAKTKP